MTFYGILVIVVVFTILVFFHELGHFLAAKLFKMRVEEFAIGFGPGKLRLFYDGETEYTIHPLPLGGFVKIAGMEIEDATEESAHDADKPRDGFNNRPLYQRFIVILAGPVFSFLLGWLTYCIYPMTIGLPDTKTASIVRVVPGGAAEAAGLKAGDTITALDGKKPDSVTVVTDTIRDAAGRPLIITLNDTKGVSREVTVIPRVEDDGGEKVGRIGVQMDQKYDSFRRLGFFDSFDIGTKTTLNWFREIGKLVRSGEIKNNVGGPVAIFTETQKAADQGGIARPTEILAQLSLSLGLANMLPIPILDGGYLVLFILEAIRRRKLTARQMERVMVSGLAVLATLFITVTFKDIRARFFPSSPKPTASPVAPSPSPSAPADAIPPK